MTDPWRDMSGGITGPVTRAVAVTPSDATPLAVVARALYVGGAGNVSLVMTDASVVTLTGLAIGVWHPIRFTQVRATGTTSTGILAGY